MNLRDFIRPLDVEKNEMRRKNEKNRKKWVDCHHQIVTDPKTNIGENYLLHKDILNFLPFFFFSSSIVIRFTYLSMTNWWLVNRILLVLLRG